MLGCGIWCIVRITLVQAVAKFNKGFHAGRLIVREPGSHAHDKKQFVIIVAIHPQDHLPVEFFKESVRLWHVHAPDLPVGAGLDLWHRPRALRDHPWWHR